MQRLRIVKMPVHRVEDNWYPNQSDPLDNWPISREDCLLPVLETRTIMIQIQRVSEW